MGIPLNLPLPKWGLVDSAWSIDGQVHFLLWAKSYPLSANTFIIGHWLLDIHYSRMKLRNRDRNRNRYRNPTPDWNHRYRYRSRFRLMFYDHENSKVSLFDQTVILFARRRGCLCDGANEKTRQFKGPAGFWIVEKSLSVFSSWSGYSLAPERFTLLAPTVFTGFFITFFQFQPFKKPVVLNLLFQDPHCFFKVIVINLYFNCLQLISPPSSHQNIDTWIKVIISFNGLFFKYIQ